MDTEDFGRNTLAAIKVDEFNTTSFTYYNPDTMQRGDVLLSLSQVDAMRH